MDIIKAKAVVFNVLVLVKIVHHPQVVVVVLIIIILMIQFVLNAQRNARINVVL